MKAFRRGNSKTGRLGRGIFCFAAFLLLVVTFKTTQALYASESVLILKSGNLLPIEEAVEAFRSAWDGDVDIFTVRSASETINTARYPIVIAIGGRAALALKSNYRKGSRALYGMVLSPGSLTLLSTDFIGISPAASFSDMFSDLRSDMAEIEVMGVIYSENSEYILETMRDSIGGTGILLKAVRISSELDIDAALEELKDVDAFYLMPDPLLIPEKNMGRIFGFFERRNIVTVAPYKIALLFGASYVYAVEPPDIGRRLATEALKALKQHGYRPGIVCVKGRLYRK